MTAERDTLLALAAEIEVLPGPSREMDARIWVALHDGFSIVKAWHGSVYVKGPDESTNVPENVTASIDSAHALLTERLSGWHYMVDASAKDMRPYVGLYREGQDKFGPSAEATATTLALAICAAKVRAVAAAQPDR